MHSPPLRSLTVHTITNTHRVGSPRSLARPHTHAHAQAHEQTDARRVRTHTTRTRTRAMQRTRARADERRRRGGVARTETAAAGWARRATLCAARWIGRRRRPPFPPPPRPLARPTPRAATTSSPPPHLTTTLFVHIHYRDFLRTSRNDYLVASFGFFFLSFLCSLFLLVHTPAPRAPVPPLAVTPATGTSSVPFRRRSDRPLSARPPAVPRARRANIEHRAGKNVTRARRGRRTPNAVEGRAAPPRGFRDFSGRAKLSRADVDIHFFETRRPFPDTLTIIPRLQMEATTRKIMFVCGGGGSVFFLSFVYVPFELYVARVYLNFTGVRRIDPRGRCTANSPPPPLPSTPVTRLAPRARVYRERRAKSPKTRRPEPAVRYRADRNTDDDADNN